MCIWNRGGITNAIRRGAGRGARGVLKGAHSSHWLQEGRRKKKESQRGHF